MHRRQTLEGSSCSHGSYRVKPSSSFFHTACGVCPGGRGSTEGLLEQELSPQLPPWTAPHRALTSQNSPCRTAEPLLQPVQGQDQPRCRCQPGWRVAEQEISSSTSSVSALSPFCLALLSFAQVSFAQVLPKDPGTLHRLPLLCRELQALQPH